MASGQKLLADLLGITNLAAQSVSTLKQLDNIVKNEDQKIVDPNEDDKAMHPKDFSKKHNPVIDLPTESGQHASSGQQDSSIMHSVSTDSVFDTSRCIPVRVQSKLLKEKQDSSVSSEKSQMDLSSDGSSERLPTPDPSDFIKSGVFVSSGTKRVASWLPSSTGTNVFQQQQRNEIESQYQQERIDYEKTKQQQQQENLPPMAHDSEQQQTIPKMKDQKINVYSHLAQGKENSVMNQVSTPEHSNEDVVVLRYPSGQKKSIVQERFKERMQNSVPVKKVAIPKIVKPSSNETEKNSVERKAQPAPQIDEAMSYAAVATSAAVAPFLQIQNALETQISSLVDTMNRAHAAEEQFKSRTQAQGLKELESKILEILDQRLKPNDIQNCVEKIAEGSSVVEWKPNASKEHYNKDDQRQKSQKGISHFDNDLQLIPTRDDGHVQKALTPLKEQIPPSSHVAPLPEPRQWNYRDINPVSQAKYAPPLDNFPVPMKYFDKSTSPLYTVKRYLANAKTQTSSSESSILSEQSILETPLPRSKIPVPFSRYTPKREGNRGYEKLNAKRQLQEGPHLHKKILKGSARQKSFGKENLAPRASSPKHSIVNTRSIKNGQNCENEEEEIEQINGKEKSKQDNEEKNELVDKIQKVAPIDRYLVYPLRGEVPNLQGIVSHQSDKEKPPLLEHIARTSTSQVQEVKGEHAKGEKGDDQGSRSHYIAASKILSEIQQRRERLESNLDAVIRQSEEQRLYEFLDTHESAVPDDTCRIRRNVDSKIQEISSQLQRELQSASKDVEKKKQTDEKMVKGPKKQETNNMQRTRKGRVVDNTQSKVTKAKKQIEKKEKAKVKVTSKVESSAGSRSTDFEKPKIYDPVVLASIIGNRFDKPHRSTVRPPYIQFHTPSKVSPKNQQLKGRHGHSAMYKNNLEHESPKEHALADVEKAKYYFQPSEHHASAENYRYPALGELVPVAQSLGKPRQDDRLRLPIPSEDLTPVNPQGTDKQSEYEITRPNFAVVEVKSDKDDQKKTRNLGIQNLPSLNIDGTWDSAPKEDAGTQKTPVKLNAVTPPKAEDYQDFQNYIACIEVDQSDQDLDDNQTDAALELKGVEDNEPRDYNEPRFPPEHPRYDYENKKAEVKHKTSIEERTTEWLEQELLARIVAQMNVPQDPTMINQESLAEGDEESSYTETEEEGQEDWIHEILGAGGVQLCIDAGIPLTKDLIEEIIKEVVAEKVKFLLGHPKRPKSPMEVNLPKVNEESFVGPSNVLTPVPTPVYTPLGSEASMIHTPLSASTTTEESFSREKSLGFEEHKDTSEDSNEDVRTTEQQGDFPEVQTPPQTPDVTKTPIPLDGYVETPLPSLRDDAKPMEPTSLVDTPDLSVAAGSLRTIDDFMSTLSERSENKERGTPAQPQEPSLKAPAPPQPPQTVPVVQVVKPRTPSDHARSFTISSSTTVGLSTFEGISEGEKLCPDYVIPGLYSEGEFPISVGQAVLSDFEGDEEDGKITHKKLLENIIGRRDKRGDESDIMSATLKDTEDLNEDTLQEVSISEGEVLDEDDPIAKLLLQIRSPPNAELTDRSEGEISKGEYMEKQVTSTVVTRVKDSSEGKSSGFPKRILSLGEIASTNKNGSQVPSLSLGEVRGVSDIGEELLSKPEDLSRNGKDTWLNLNVKHLEGDSLNEQEIIDDDVSKLSNGKEDSDNIFERGPNTILVQSGNFGTASSFNFTDSLNEPHTDALREQKIDDVIDEHSLIEEGERSELSSEGSGEPMQKGLPADKQPTKIMLMIPSVADEDSADEVTFEGDGPYSNDDVSNISL